MSHELQTRFQTAWPVLPSLEAWSDTLTTVHMWSQIVGKIRLALGPPINHSWGTTLYVTSTGLTTSPIPFRSLTFAIDFDFIRHRLEIATSEGGGGGFALEPMPVADFHQKVFALLRELAIEVEIFGRPVEVVEAIPFKDDRRHSAYDALAVGAFWRALVQSTRVFGAFRARFFGKASPVHFFWGSFDLAITRFSGRTAPRHPGGVPNCPDRVMIEAYSKELASAGFWAGNGLGEAAFYAYAYPTPAGYKDSALDSPGAYFDEGLGEFILPYRALLKSVDPDALLLHFLQETYEAAANLADWDRRALEHE